VLSLPNSAWLRVDARHWWEPKEGVPLYEACTKLIKRLVSHAFTLCVRNLLAMCYVLHRHADSIQAGCGAPAIHRPARETHLGALVPRKKTQG
jgi:hypothetical protein